LLPIRVSSRERAAADAADSSKALAMMMAAFAVVSLGLALMGIYGIVAFSVEQRTREVGIRVALGADAADIIRVFVAYGARLAAIGLGLGLVVAVAMGRIMSSFVVGAVTSHVVIAVAVTVLFAGVAVAASYLPARRAARLDPVVALRR
jgi:putative ABC transport system permease protein